MLIRILCFFVAVNFIISGSVKLFAEDYEEKIKVYESRVIEKEEKFIGGSMVLRQKTFKNLFPEFIKHYTDTLTAKTGSEKEKFSRKVFFLQEGIVSFYNYTADQSVLFSKHLEKILKCEFQLNCHMEYLRNILSTIFFEIKSENILNMNLLHIIPVVEKVAVFYDTYSGGLPFYYSYVPDYKDLKKKTLSGCLPAVSEEIIENLSLKHKMFMNSFNADLEKRFCRILDDLDFNETDMAEGENYFKKIIDSAKNQLGTRLEKASGLEEKINKNTVDIEGFMDEQVFIEKDEKISKWNDLMKENLAAMVQLTEYKKVMLDFLPGSLTDRLKVIHKNPGLENYFEVDITSTQEKVKTLENIDGIVLDICALEEFPKEKIREIKFALNSNEIAFRMTLEKILKDFKADDYSDMFALNELETEFKKMISFESILNNLMNSRLFFDREVNRDLVRRYGKFISKIVARLQVIVPFLARKTGVSVTEDQAEEVNKQKLKMLSLLGEESRQNRIPDSGVSRNPRTSGSDPASSDSGNSANTAANQASGTDSPPAQQTSTGSVAADTNVSGNTAVADPAGNDSVQDTTASNNPSTDTQADPAGNDNILDNLSNWTSKPDDATPPSDNAGETNSTNDPVSNADAGTTPDNSTGTSQGTSKTDSSILDALSNWTQGSKNDTAPSDTVSNNSGNSNTGTDVAADNTPKNDQKPPENILDSLSNWVSKPDDSKSDHVVTTTVKIDTPQENGSDLAMNVPSKDPGSNKSDILDVLSGFINENKDDKTGSKTIETPPDNHVVKTDSHEFTRYISEKENFSFDYPSNTWIESQKMSKYEVTLRHEGRVLPAISAMSELTQAGMSLKDFVELRKIETKNEFKSSNYKFIMEQNIRNVYYSVKYEIDFFGIKCSCIDYIKGDGNNFFIVNGIVPAGKEDEIESDLESVFKSLRIMKLLTPPTTVTQKTIATTPVKTTTTPVKTQTTKNPVKTVVKTVVKNPPVKTPPVKTLSLKDRIAQIKNNMKNQGTNVVTSTPPVVSNSGVNTTGLNDFEKYWYNKINEFDRELVKWETTTFVQKRRIKVSKQIQFKVKDLYRDIRIEEGKVEKHLKQYGEVGHIKNIRNLLGKLHFRASDINDWAL